ncbi:di-heme oxidoreductase family protein [Cobetia crustatorum]|nr:di-heme oxidoredictase family protein [Cobetia crustatorum]
MMYRPMMHRPMMHALPLAIALATLATTAVTVQAAPITTVTEYLSALPLQNTAKSGGEGSVRKHDTNAYSLPAKNMSFDQRLSFSVGNSFFKSPWVIAPASTTARDGLGPLFNTNACQNCHVKDGRGSLPAGNDPAVGLFLRLGMPDSPEHSWDDEEREFRRISGVMPHPVYGTQLQNASVPGVPQEGRMQVDYQQKSVTLADGEVITLRAPHYSIVEAGFGDPGPIALSPRLAPGMVGLGLLEAVSDAMLLEWADPEDNDGDGISGKPNTVWSIADDALVQGRFGWKAGQPSVRQQSAKAFAGDMGLTSSLVGSTDCTPVQKCDVMPSGGTIEVEDNVMDNVAFYSRNLAVPTRRDIDAPEVRAGEQLFRDLQCASCHRPTLTTDKAGVAAQLAGQVIWPYSDMLLHDMGDALSDNRREFEATGNEWRTPPLWGIGLAQTVNSATGFLHDGRARTLLEAVLWHGGEAQSSRDAVVALPTEQRESLLRFLESL